MAEDRIPRKEARIGVNWKCAIEKLGEREQHLPAPLAAVYERVQADVSDVGGRPGLRLRDISMNGAFIEGEALPLLSRVAMVFDVPGFHKVEAVGWVMWRRREACTIERDDGSRLTLGPGFGILFEWISLEARLEIARRIARNQPE
jgi:hypothetical protein